MVPLVFSRPNGTVNSSASYLFVTENVEYFSITFMYGSEVAFAYLFQYIDEADSRYS